MRAPWPVYAVEVAGVAAALVLIGVAFGWMIAAVFGGAFVLLSVLAWVAARVWKNANRS